MEKVIGLYKVYFKDASGALRVAIVNDFNEIKAPATFKNKHGTDWDYT